MCGCTLYDSPTCGHSWISMSQPCGFLSDLLNCPYRQVYQTLIAPPYTCPMCNSAFADHETIEMVQGPWGCNQMIRNCVGGNFTIPGQWDNARQIPNEWGVPAITSHAMAGAVVPIGHVRGLGYDHRLTGPYTPAVPDAAIINHGPMVCNTGLVRRGHGHYPNGRRKRTKQTHYKYKYTDKPATDCTVM
ncbi:uncharacterized protein yc1106_00663 [Curvularia clavata]|uniref:Uncharacterized protein n=1 Tax=Curvularia clavata TaxID=95742 RepID=A0A9Q9DP86_CURCL|nr:uncharacterized protein yc1106_00663 [Curvularia clavata]